MPIGKSTLGGYDCRLCYQAEFIADRNPRAGDLQQRKPNLRRRVSIQS
jgi:hypothetical protein